MVTVARVIMLHSIQSWLNTAYDEKDETVVVKYFKLWITSIISKRFHLKAAFKNCLPIIQMVKTSRLGKGVVFICYEGFY